ncbi:MAG: ATP-binding protein [Phycisphaerales bacterium]
MLILSVIQGPDKGRKYQLPANQPQLVGRSSEALPISDTTVSRRHAELTPDDGEWWIRDLNSQNGTWVNGVQITERTRLRLGDQVRTGATLFVFGRAESGDEIDLIRVLDPDRIETTVERTLPSNDDSVILAEPEPRSAAVHHLQVIYRLTALTTHTTNRDDLLKAVMDLVFTEFKPERGFIMLAAPTEGREGGGGGEGQRAAAPDLVPVVVKHRTPPKDKSDARIHVSKTILQHAMSGGEGVLSSNAMSDPRFAKGDSVQQFHIRSALCSPIEFGDRKFGAIYVDSSIANYTFTAEQLALLNAIGRHTGLALANAEAYAKRLATERLAAIGETVAILSHSIKNILQGLRGGADVVEMGLKKEDLKVARGGWGILKRNIDRISSLTLNMLAYARHRTLEFELTKVAPLLEDCASLLQDQCSARQVALLIDADADLPPIMLDPSLIHQALVNLMANAVEAVEAKTGVVTVRATYIPAVAAQRGMPAQRPAVRIDVIDNGPGIAPERHKQIFEPFQTSKGLRGTGLGLAVTKSIVEQHNGRILVTSNPARGPHAGATFTMILPADNKVPADPSATTGAKPTGDQILVL